MATDVIGQSTVSEPEDVAPDELEAVDEPTVRRPRWRPDLWWSVAAGLVVVQLAVRWWVALGLDMYQDDVVFTYRALDSRLDSTFLLETYDGHFGPLWKLVQWATVQVAPFDFGVAIATVLVALLIADIGMLLALREIFGRGRLALTLFAFFTFVPLTVVASGSWTIGAILIPVLAGMAWTTFFHARAVRRSSRRWMVAAAACLAVSALVSPQTLFLMPFLVVWTLAYPRLTRTGRLRATLRRTWGLWLMYAGVVAGYLVLYRAASPQRITRPPTLGTLGEAFGDGVLGTALPSLFGGPWSSDPGGWPSYGQLGVVGTSLLLQLLALVVIVTIWARPQAWRAWAGLAVLVLVLVLTLAIAVHYDLTEIALLRQPRYTAVLLVPGIVLLGCTWACGPMRPSARRFLGRIPRAAYTALAVVAILVFVESAWVTTYQQATAMKTATTRTFWDNVRAGMAEHPTAALVDRLMPAGVVYAGFLPEAGTAKTALRYFITDQKFGEPSETPFVITDEGKVVRGSVAEFARSYPGRVPGCGYVVRQAPVAVPMNQQAFNFSWGVQVNYLAQRDTVVEVGGGGVTRMVPLKQGLHTVTLELPGELPRVRIRGTEPGVAVCVDQVVVGGIVPNPSLAD